MPFNISGIPMPDLPHNSFSKGFKSMGDLIKNIQSAKQARQIMPLGNVANALYVENLRQKFGDQDPRYLRAKEAFDSNQENIDSLIGYRGIRGQVAPYNATSSLGKKIAESKGQGALDVVGGKGKNTSLDASNDQDNAGSGRPLTPQEAKAYERAIAKDTTDSSARNIYNRAVNVEKTISNLDLDALTQYSGLKNIASYLKDQADATAGHPSERYLKFKEASTASNLLSKQLRQFYGDSIQPTAVERIDKLTNPTTWYKDSKVAKKELEQLINIIKTETETYKEAGTSPIKVLSYDPDKKEFYTKDEPPKSTQSNASNEIDLTGLSDDTIVTVENEKTGEQEKMTLAEARKRGASNG